MADEMDDRPLAAVFCRTFLPYSETFIYDEVRSHQRWGVEIFCRARENQDRFSHGRVTTAGGALGGLALRLTMHCAAFERALRTGTHRLLHAHFGTNAPFALPYQKRLGRPLIVTFHGFDVGALVGPPRARPGLLRYRALAPRILQRADLLLCASTELAEIISRLSGRPSATRLYRLGIDLQRFGGARERRPVAQVTMIGRFVEKKGHLDGIEAFALALRSGADARLSLVGDGPLRAAYLARIVQLGLGEHVTFAGVLRPREVAELLSRTDVLVAPSRVARSGDRDSGLLVAKEAAAAKVAVIGTRHGGIPEIIDDGVTGYLVAEGDVAAMAERLAALLEDAPLRERMGAAGRAKMEREYDLRVRVEELERLYDSVAP